MGVGVELDVAAVAAAGGGVLVDSLATSGLTAAVLGVASNAIGFRSGITEEGGGASVSLLFAAVVKELTRDSAIFTYKPDGKLAR